MIVGKRLGMFLAVLVLLAGGLAACGGGDDDDGGGGDGNGDDAAVSEIQQLYIDVGCAECHGENGEGDGANPKTEIAGTRMIIQQFKARVRNGRGSAMPGYSEDQITEEQIEQMWEWLRE
ncbi:MAG: cytochrome c [Thermomicrobiales bacterium]